MEATCSSETQADFQRTTKHYIPEDNSSENNTVFRMGPPQGVIYLLRTNAVIINFFERE
jgi:hypothetical protein